MNQKSIGKAGNKVKTTFIEEARRNQILEVALKEIETKGYRNTTIQDIAKKAKVSKGVIYYHFNTKEELLSTIWSALIKELFEYRKKRVERRSSARDMLQAYLAANFEFLKLNFNKFTALFRMGIDLNPAETRNYPWSKEINERCFNFLSDILNSGQQNGEFRRFPIGSITPIIQGAIDGLCLQWISAPELFDLEACEQMLLEIIERFTSVDEKPVS
jgi:AcrR family transcriptional regulator